MLGLGTRPMLGVQQGLKPMQVLTRGTPRDGDLVLVWAELYRPPSNWYVKVLAPTLQN